MSNTSKTNASAIGLDVGTSRIVTAQRLDKTTQYQTQLNAFVTLPFSKLTQGVLKKERIPHLVQDSEITVYGDESERFANLFHKETRRPMLRGVLNPEETNSLKLVREIVAETLHDLIDPLIYDEAASLIEEHHLAGRDVVIVST